MHHAHENVSGDVYVIIRGYDLANFQASGKLSACAKVYTWILFGGGGGGVAWVRGYYQAFNIRAT